MALAAAGTEGRGAGIKGIAISTQVFEDSAKFIRTVQEGLSGAIVRQAVESVGHRELFISILGVQSSNLSKVYRRKRLNKNDSESVLDFLRVFRYATDVFEDAEKANEWLETKVPALGGKRPIELCDTFEGRELVRAALCSIEYGDFS